MLENNRPKMEEPILFKRKVNKPLKEKANFFEHAIAKNYLQENERPKLSSILGNLNAKISEARRKYQRRISVLGN
jgi:hypothetical protein